MNELSSLLLIIAAGGWIIKETLSIIRSRSESDKEITRQDLKEHSKEMKELATSVTKLSGQVEALVERIDEYGIPKLKEDLQRLWGKFKINQKNAEDL